MSFAIGRYYPFDNAAYLCLASPTYNAPEISVRCSQSGIVCALGMRGTDALDAALTLLDKGESAARIGSFINSEPFYSDQKQWLIVSRETQTVSSWSGSSLLTHCGALTLEEDSAAAIGSAMSEVELLSKALEVACDPEISAREALTKGLARGTQGLKHLPLSAGFYQVDSERVSRIVISAAEPGTLMEEIASATEERAEQLKLSTFAIVIEGAFQNYTQGLSLAWGTPVAERDKLLMAVKELILASRLYKSVAHVDLRNNVALAIIAQALGLKDIAREALGDIFNSGELGSQVALGYINDVHLFAPDGGVLSSHSYLLEALAAFHDS